MSSVLTRNLLRQISRSHRACGSCRGLPSSLQPLTTAEAYSRGSFLIRPGCVQSITVVHLKINPPWFCQRSYFSSQTEADASDDDESSSDADAKKKNQQKHAISSFRKLIQPFLIKCHPDMARQYQLSADAQKINLQAIQNLNAYMDGLTQVLQDPFFSTSPQNPSDKKNISIEFVLAFQSETRKHSVPTTSRRTVQLRHPSPSRGPHKIPSFYYQELSKLLHMAGLPVPPKASILPEDYLQEVPENNDGISNAQEFGIDEDRFWMQQQQRRRPKTRWEQSRDRFTRSINWTKFDLMYNQAVADMHANQRTRGMIRNHPKRRKRLIATILSHVEFNAQAVTPLEQLVCLRRLLRLLEGNFDRLQLEDMGNFWEKLSLKVNGARSYNTSTSALSKRRRKKLDTGFSFTIASDHAVTIEVPVDFFDEELVEELDRNVWDFYDWMQQSEGIDSIFEN